MLQVLKDLIARGADPANVRIVAVVAAPPALKLLADDYPGAPRPPRLASGRPFAFPCRCYLLSASGGWPLLCFGELAAAVAGLPPPRSWSTRPRPPPAAPTRHNAATKLTESHWTTSTKQACASTARASTPKWMRRATSSLGSATPATARLARSRIARRRRERDLYGRASAFARRAALVVVAQAGGWRAQL